MHLLATSTVESNSLPADGSPPLDARWTGLALRFLSGPDATPTQPVRIGRSTLGRADTNTIRIDDPSIEPHHVLLDGEPGTVAITQLAGRVPIRLGESPVDESTALQAGAVVSIGNSRLRVDVVPDDVSTTCDRGRPLIPQAGGDVVDLLDRLIGRRGPDDARHQSAAAQGVAVGRGDVELSAGDVAEPFAHWCRQANLARDVACRIGLEAGSTTVIRGAAHDIAALGRSLVVQLAAASMAGGGPVVIVTSVPDRWKWAVEALAGRSSRRIVVADPDDPELDLLLDDLARRAAPTGNITGGMAPTLVTDDATLVARIGSPVQRFVERVGAPTLALTTSDATVPGNLTLDVGVTGVVRWTDSDPTRCAWRAARYAGLSQRRAESALRRIALRHPATLAW